MKKRDLKKTLYGWLQKAFASSLLVTGIMAGCLYGMLWGIEAYAAEDIQVMELCVVHDQSGIRASCVYQNFDSNNSILQLYLEKMDADGEFFPLGYVDLAVTGEEKRTAITSPQAAEPGMYRAVLLQYYGEGVPVVRFRDSGVYEVKDPGDMDADLAGNTDGVHFPENADSSDGWICEHTIVESVIQQATPMQDAILAEGCEKCGQVFGYIEVPNSAYTAFLNEVAGAIKAALPGEQVVVTTDRWMSFDVRVFEAIESRRDISILIKYHYQGAEHQIWIPAESDMSGLIDENGFCGFAYLSQRFGEKIDEWEENI